MALPATSELVRAGGTVLRYCFYGPPDGHPVVWHNGSPSSRWKWPTVAEAMERSKLRVLVYDRPGYGGSTRRPGRTVADAASDVRDLADACGWEQFAVFGGSGGGPHALACAALLAGRVTRCAVLSGIKPRDPGDQPQDEASLRSQLADVAAQILAPIEAGGPEIPSEPGPPARDDPDAMSRVRATFVDSLDGWVDDSLAFAQPWGFDLAEIRVPVGVWRGSQDHLVPGDHSGHLLAHIATAQGHVYPGGHLPGAAVYDDIHTWLAAGLVPD
ncbi:alpha/beta fold hydrolase [Longispora albida]|uniref:alpha/beta fold hydrolase n=1 Tax=Longispora albida TaxID=203523 RepID=UPI000380D6DB|nr:alpha/beta fold hydrolase [Longispora albida]